MDGYRKNSHAIHDIKYHVIWVTKYRYKILRGPIAIRARELIRQGCEARGIIILQGSVGKDHIHLLLSCPPSLAPSKIMQYLKGRSSRLLQDEFPDLKKEILGTTFMGERILLCNCWNSYRGNHKKLYSQSIQRRKE